MDSTRQRIVITAAMLSLFFVAPHPARPAQTDAGVETQSFQLVYHSDTRGYYRPCG